MVPNGCGCKGSGTGGPCLQGSVPNGPLLDSAPTMGPLAAVERFLERLFEGQSARLFRTQLRPVQVQRRVERAMETNRVRDGRRTVVPHDFVVRLATQDATALRVSEPRLAANLADAALSFARAHGYTLLDRPRVTLREDPTIDAGDVAIDIVMSDASAAIGEPAGSAAATDGDGDGDRTGTTRHAAVPPAMPTAVFVVPGADGPRATIREVRSDGSGRSVELNGRPMTIGRAPDNVLVLADSRASRHHARIDARRGSLVLTDLGSTNGSWVNGRRVESIALGQGDRLRIGTTELLVETVEPIRRD